MEGMETMKYQIKIQGLLDESWSDWLGEVEITHGEENGVLITTICGEASDQPALFGILNRIRDLNLALISVVQTGQTQ
jgi:hypothetical protein